MNINAISYNNVSTNKMYNCKKQSFSSRIPSAKVINNITNNRVQLGVIDTIGKTFEIMKTNYFKKSNKNFTLSESFKIAKNLKEDDILLLNSLLKANDMFGNRRYNASEIAQILKINQNSAETRELVEAQILVPDGKTGILKKIGLPYFNDNAKFIKGLERYFKNKA